MNEDLKTCKHCAHTIVYRDEEWWHVRASERIKACLEIVDCEAEPR